MASANKSTALQISIILLFVTTGVFAAMWYVSSDEARTELASNAQLKKELADEQALKRAKDDQLEEIKRLYDGGQSAEIGEPGAPADGSLIFQINADRINLGGAAAQNTNNLSSTIQRMREVIDTITRERDAVQADTNDLREHVKTLKEEYQSREDQFSETAQKAKDDIVAQIAITDELIEERDQDIAALRKETRERTIELDRMEDQLKTEREESESEIKKLTARNIDLQAQLQEVRRESFEVPDGHIRWVDHGLGLVYINLGSADNLRERTTFSVYQKANSGVARGPEDIKGAIEVTRILEPHLAEARLLQVDNYRPVASGDLVYSPIWTAGRTEHVSFVGLIDIDNDGRSDRDQLHDIMKSSGAIIDNEVDDNGDLTPESTGIDVNTVFLVIAKIPDPAEVVDTERDAAKRIAAQVNELEKQARQQGVRVINFPDFLDYLGYTPTRRLYVPGSGTEITLKAGAHSTGVNETITDRHSTGSVSGLFSRGRRLLRPGESGKPKKVFRYSR